MDGVGGGGWDTECSNRLATVSNRTSYIQTFTKQGMRTQKSIVLPCAFCAKLYTDGKVSRKQWAKETRVQGIEKPSHCSLSALVWIRIWTGSLTGWPCRTVLHHSALKEKMMWNGSREGNWGVCGRVAVVKHSACTSVLLPSPCYWIEWE